ncbi:hypothetical protein [Desulfoluna butyratoxydans]|uniref:Winged helix-turn-helix dna-binding domain n=1 Tax=Desulfoluna butyratoxydans TaxID=231438 RepID=A0A4U8YS11_9BACT|nr:hypothetical protein [Desulfoluna butyratoxydans]VFQ46691.1 winged helix-turn-helix dna-binding domain [Desulfoluna butyratoxydans]
MVLKGNIASSVYRRAVREDLGEVSLDSRMLTLLMQLNGEKNTAELAGELGLTLSDIRDVLIRLDHLGLIEEVVSSVPTLSGDFYPFLTDQLSKAMGPMAEILLEDLLQEMALDRESIPLTRAAELVDALAREIPRDEKRAEFQQVLLSRLKNF